MDVHTCELQWFFCLFSGFCERGRNCTPGTIFHRNWIWSIWMSDCNDSLGHYNCRNSNWSHDLCKYDLDNWYQSSCVCTGDVRDSIRRLLRSWHLSDSDDHVFLSIIGWIKVDLTSSPSYVANMQVKQYVPGFLVVTNPNNSVKNWKNFFCTKKLFIFLQKWLNMIHSGTSMGVTMPQVHTLFC